MKKVVRILGTHGVPAAYGGFETAAENVGRHLLNRGWRVIVYCQIPGHGSIYEDTWEGMERVNIPVSTDGWLGTSRFDLISIRHASRFSDICLTFGYNTAIFNVLQRLNRIPNIINMDGIEWSRSRWGKFKQAILYVNERIACYVGSHLIADHPEIEKYLRTRARDSKITTITYGADAVTEAPDSIPRRFGLEPSQYFTLIARPIPENSILELVSGFSSAVRGMKLVLLGNYSATDPYQAQVLRAASAEVVFLGAIYEPKVVQALRYHSVGYLHGHTVGGTNPSLVEALGSGNAVIAHDNAYNRWVAQDAGLYFETEDDISNHIYALCSDRILRSKLAAAARKRHLHEFTWEHIADQYEELLSAHLKSGDSDLKSRGVVK